MAGICSEHRDFEPGCLACRTDIHDVLPDWDDKLAEAKAAGEVRCRCGFVYYRTTRECPLCSETKEGAVRSDKTAAEILAILTEDAEAANYHEFCTLIEVFTAILQQVAGEAVTRLVLLRILEKGGHELVDA